LAPDNSVAPLAIRLIGWLCKAVIAKLRGISGKPKQQIQIEGLDWLRSSLVTVISGDLGFTFTAQKDAVEAIFDMSTENVAVNVGLQQQAGGKPPPSIIAGLPEVKKWLITLTPNQKKKLSSPVRADFNRLLLA